MWRFLVGLVFIGMCAGVYLWTFYDSKVINIIELYTGMGVIFSSIGAMATVFVFRSTALATQKTKESVDIASKALSLSMENREIENFHQELSYMLSDCEKKYDDVLKNIPDFTKNSLISDKHDSFLNWDMDNDKVISKISDYKEILIYVRGVSNIIHFIDNFILFNDSKKEWFVNMIRDKINNDILFIFAITIHFKSEEFNKDIPLFEKFNFFKRLVFLGEGKNISFKLNELLGIKTKYYIDEKIYNIIAMDMNKLLPSNLHLEIKREYYLFMPSSFYINLLVEIKSAYLSYVINRIEGVINTNYFDDIVNRFNHVEDKEYYIYTVSSFKKDSVFSGNALRGICISKDYSNKLYDLAKIIIDENLDIHGFNKLIGWEEGHKIVSSSHVNANETVIGLSSNELYNKCLEVIHSNTFSEINKENYKYQVKNKIVEIVNNSKLSQSASLIFFLDEDDDKIKLSYIPI
ncbi:putative phage abortive infection protein [Proteus mirabilis]|uniref:putative phage abortive infection protein n=1 Tax=Proteus mirabilis TaxID=584 RepID=UPI001F0466B4|nr:putative phage abortive infection protein [Proteus mirabilis]HEK0447952.1 hypothetical protein [Proteus mirabilis]